MPASDPMEDLELEEAIERIRQGERRRRHRRRGVVAVAFVAILVVLVAGAWAVLRLLHASPTAQVGTPPRAPVAVATPAPAEPNAPPREEQRAAAPEPAAPSDAPYIGALGGLPETPEPERELPERRPSPREETARRPARPLPRPPEVTPPRRELPEPVVAARPPRARQEAIDREVRVEIATEALGDGLTSYTVRLRERDGRPVTDATVSIRGRRADGALLEAMLDRAGEPGAYRAVVRRLSELTDARVRVASVDRVQEVPLPDAPR
jgi:hypothetical protein